VRECTDGADNGGSEERMNLSAIEGARARLRGIVRAGMGEGGDIGSAMRPGRLPGELLPDGSDSPCRCWL
jgi:hypothetical protein